MLDHNCALHYVWDRELAGREARFLPDEPTPIPPKELNDDFQF